MPCMSDLSRYLNGWMAYPSQRQIQRERQRRDPLAGIFDEDVVPMLQAAPGLRSVAIFEEIYRRHPELDGRIRRTLERRIRTWRAIHGPEQEVIFRHFIDEVVSRKNRRNGPRIELLRAGVMAT